MKILSIQSPQNTTSLAPTDEEEDNSLRALFEDKIVSFIDDFLEDEEIRESFYQRVLIPAVMATITGVAILTLRGNSNH
jgi:hypothetical protein